MEGRGKRGFPPGRASVVVWGLFCCQTHNAWNWAVSVRAGELVVSSLCIQVASCPEVLVSAPVALETGTPGTMASTPKLRGFSFPLLPRAGLRLGRVTRDTGSLGPTGLSDGWPVMSLSCPLGGRGCCPALTMLHALLPSTPLRRQWCLHVGNEYVGISGCPGTELVPDDILGVCLALSPMHHSPGCLLSRALVRAEWCGPLFPAWSP